MTRNFQKEAFPILEFDALSKPIIDAKNLYEPGKVKRCVITYFQEIVENWERADKINQTFRIRTEGVRPRVYAYKTPKEIVYIMPVAGGAPYAARALEVLNAMGVKKFMVCGGAGTLHDEKTQGNILIPTAAVRDEGTSYHYLPPAREVFIGHKVLKVIKRTLDDLGEKYVEVKTWTTDASFRETEYKVELRRGEGCDVVEMETAAYFAVAEHKNIEVGQLLYAGDVVKKEGWEFRNWHTKTDIRERLLELAIQIVLEM